MQQTFRPDPDRLYKLLPAMYRDADAAKGYPLQALMRLIGGQAGLLRSDIQQLWDNFFIETCEQWAVPYIGDLVSNRTLYDIDQAQDSSTAESLFPDLAGPQLRPVSPIRTRADVAKTIYYRRRKGTTAMLQQLAGDVTGWGAYVVEFFELLTWTQNLNHLRLQSTGCADLRNPSVCVKADGPFDGFSHVADVRAIAQSEGWYNVPNLGFFLWRLQSFPVTLAQPRAIGNTNWRYTFSPLGNSAPLFAIWTRSIQSPGMSPELLVPEAIPRSAFFDDLAAWKVSPVPRPDHSIYYGNEADYLDGSITVYEQAAAAGSTPVPVDVSVIRCQNLSKWTTMAQPADDRIGIDVENGRMIVGKARPPATIYASYNYGFSAHMGGGPYADRQKWIVPLTSAERVINVPADATLDNAITMWQGHTSAHTIIRIADSATHQLTVPLTLDPKKWLLIQAEPTDPYYRPHILPANGAIQITAGAGGGSGSMLTLNGLLIEGGIEVTQDIQTLRILHCTLVPGRSILEEAVAPPTGPSIKVSATGAVKPINDQANVQIAFSITGPLILPETINGLWILDSIVDSVSTGVAIGNAAAAIPPGAGGNGPRATIERSTILGKSYFRKIDLCSDTIFTDLVTVEDRVAGCLRFSFVPDGSSVPQQYRCQPSMEITSETDSTREAAQRLGIFLMPGWDKPLRAEIDGWLLPSFETRQYGQPEYCQLRLATPSQIRTGASDGSEMGAFNHLKQAQRETNLRIRFQEYVPFGREPGIIYVT